MGWEKSDTMQLVQTFALVSASIFAAYQIKLAAGQLRAGNEASSAVALGTVMNASAELQWRILQDPSLHAIYLPSAKPTGLSRDEKLVVLRGMMISNYAFIFNIHQLGQIPEDTWSGMSADMHGFFTREDNRRQWDRVKELYQGGFRSFVDNDLLRRPK